MQALGNHPFSPANAVELARAQIPQSEPTPIHDAAQLTNGGSLARINLNGQIYSLRITRQGKLILTK